MLYRKDFSYIQGQGLVHNPTGIAYPYKGVNKILSEGMPKVNYNKARTESGIKTHENIEQAFLAKDFSKLPQLQSYLNTAPVGIEWHCEVFVSYQGNTRGCVGFIDAIGLGVDGSVLVVDWKTKSNHKISPISRQQAYLQVSAYSLMFSTQYGIKDSNLLIPTIVYLFGNGGFQVETLSQKELYEGVHTFLTKLNTEV